MIHFDVIPLVHFDASIPNPPAFHADIYCKLNISLFLLQVVLLGFPTD